MLNQTGSTNFSRVARCVLAYLYSFTQTPALALFKYGEIAETRKRRGAFFQHASMIGGYLVPTRLPLLRTFHRLFSSFFLLCTALNTCTFSRPEFEDWQKKSQKRVKAILHPKTSCLVSPGGEVKTGHRHDPKKSQNMGRPR